MFRKIVIIMVIFSAGCSAVLPESDILAEGVTESENQSSTSVPQAEVGDQVLVSAGDYPIVDSGQVICYDDSIAISCPEEGETFYGQDAQYTGNQPSYQDNGDGTITDLNTGLMWIQDARDKVFYYDGVEAAENFEFAGYDDWRVPTIKELYSLMDASGIDDADAGTDPFIDTGYFVFEYGDTSIGERSIDSQWITSTIYVDTVMNGQECFFGVNFADGRIKCYPTSNRNDFFLRLVRGDAYGLNDFVDSGNGTITDTATGLMWQQDDSNEGMDWPSALNYCETLTTGGFDDWRLPNSKELQSIVDYSRSPDTTNSAAIDPLFDATEINNEGGEKDYAFYWTSTTFVNRFGGDHAVYVIFGRGLGYFDNQYMDVHGAGAQRSDPKTGDSADFPSSFGPQGDVSRLNNYVRCVRGVASDEIVMGGEVLDSAAGVQGQSGQPPEIDFASAAAQLGVTEQVLRDALGKPGQGPPNFAAVAAQLGVTEEVLLEVLGLPGGGPPE